MTGIAGLEKLSFEQIPIIGQPEETLATVYFTKIEYIKPHDKEDLSTDYWHKNVKYGKATVIKILEHLKLRTFCISGRVNLI